MALDALFVGVLRWGSAGAAVATGLSQCVGGVLPFLYFLRPNRSLLRLVKTRLEARPLLRACGNGASVLILPLLLGVDGIWWAITVAELCACILSVLFLMCKPEALPLLVNCAAGCL